MSNKFKVGQKVYQVGLGNLVEEATVEAIREDENLFLRSSFGAPWANEQARLWFATKREAIGAQIKRRENCIEGDINTIVKLRIKQEKVDEVGG